jgi:predicted permease
MKFLRRLHYWSNRRKIRSELEEEIEFHRAMKRESLEQSGLAPEQSYAAASRSMGNVTMALEDARHVWVWQWLDHLTQDIRYSLRLFRKNPAFTLIAVLSLALGIGANSMVFTMVNALLFKPLPVEQPDRLVWAYAMPPGSADPKGFSYPDYLDYRSQSDSFSDIYAYDEMPFRVSGTREPAVVWGAAATENFFTGLGLKASLGRTFSPADGNAAGAVPLAVISDSLWRRQFGGDATAIGKDITINGRGFTIIGVLPAAFSGVRELGFIPDIWIPLGMAGDSMVASMKNRNDEFLFMLGRLKPGVRIEAASASLNTVAQRLNREYRKPATSITVHLIRAARKTNPYIEKSGIVQLGSALSLAMVGFVLLIACANVANLTLTRLSSRRREIALRLALGATRRRLMRQLLVESVLLSLIGGAAGFMLGVWVENAGGRTMTPNLDFDVVDTAHALGVDWRILLFTATISLVAGLICGLTPALQASHADLSGTLKGTLQIRSSGRLRNVLVVTQVALCIVLLFCSGLSVRSALNAHDIDPGFTTRNLFLMRVNLELQGYDQEHRKQFYRDVRQRLESLPGVAQASVGFPLPLDTYDFERRAVPEGFVPGPGKELGFNVRYSIVAPAYFATMQTRLDAGRDFTEADSDATEHAVIVNHVLAQKFWPGEEPIGKRIRLGVSEGPFATVVGVAQDGKYQTLGETPRPYMFLAALQEFPNQATIVVRTKGNPANTIGAARQQIREIDPALAVLGIQTIDQFRGRLLSMSDTLALLLAASGVIALMLAGIGLYGVISVSVGQRTHEIGIRIAIGARRADVIGMIMKQSGRIVLAGVFAGTFGAIAFGRMMRNLLYGVSTADTFTISAAFGIVITIAIIAMYIPARRAASANPLATLRCE